MLTLFRSTLHSLARSPRLAGTAALVLALGLGAASALFSLLDRVLLDPVPYPEGSRLVSLWRTSQDGARGQFSGYHFGALAGRTPGLEAVGALSPGDTTLQGPEGPMALPAIRISGTLLPLLRVKPRLGRLSFTPEEDRLGGPGAVILSHTLWKERFRGDSDMVGRSLVIGGRSRTVVGVLPADFRPPTPRAGEPALFLPIQFRSQELTPGSGANYEVIGRLKPGVSLAQADREVKGLAAGQDRTGMRVTSLGSDLAQPYHDRLALMGWAVGLLLALTLANASALLLARLGDRQAVLVLKGALGASPGTLARDVAMECLGVGLLGAAGGLVLEVPLRRLLAVQLGLASAPPRPDWVLPTALALGLGSGLAVGLLPAWRALRIPPTQALRELGTGASPRMGARKALVALEVALSFMLLAGAALLTWNLWTQLRRGPGFDARGLFVTQVALPQDRHALAGPWARQLAARLKGEPGMTALGVGLPVPLFSPGGEGTTRGVGEAPSAPTWIHFMEGDPAGALGLRYLQGRPAREGEDAVVISLPLARMLWPGGGALGRQLEAPDGPRTVVGVVEGSREFGLDDPLRPQVFQGIPPGHELPWLNLVMRTRADAATLRSQVRSALADLDPTLALGEIVPFGTVIRKVTREDRAATLPLGALALSTALLATLGLHGLLGQLFHTRRREMGVRAALGATPRSLWKLVLAQGFRLLLAGLGAGSLAAMALGRLLRHGLLAFPALDLLSALVAGLILLLATLLACFRPALRAARTQPAEELRGLG